MSQFGVGVNQGVSIAALLERMRQNDYAQQMQQQQFQARQQLIADEQAREQRAVAERKAQDDATRAVWMDLLSQTVGQPQTMPETVAPSSPGVPSVMAADDPAMLPAASQGAYLEGMTPSAPTAAPASPLSGIDPAVLSQADPRTVQAVAQAAISERSRAEQMQQEAGLAAFEQQTQAIERTRRRMAMVNRMKRLGFSDQDIESNLLMNDLAEQGAPASQMNLMGDQLFSSGMTQQDLVALGVPEQQAGVLGGQGVSPSEARQWIPGAAEGGMAPEVIDEQIADLVRGIEGEGVDLSNPATWSRIDPAGVEFARFKLRQDGTITDTVLRAMMPDNDQEARVRMLRDIYQQEMGAFRLMSRDVTTDPFVLDAQRQRATQAEAEYRRAAGGEASVAPSRQTPAASPPPPIEVQDQIVQNVIETLRQSLGRTPSAAEIDAEVRRSVGGG